LVSHMYQLLILLILPLPVLILLFLQDRRRS
jgi:hypothetical protein